MILADKISTLRRSNNLSQEELAEKMNVSRQSVSKWESGGSIPDINKIIALSQIFGVSTDYLLKDEIEKDETVTIDTSSIDDVKNITIEEANSFMDAVASVAHRIAVGVALCIMSPIVLLILAGYSEENPFTEEMAVGIGVAVLVVFVAIGVLLFITSSMKTSRYDYIEKEIIKLEYGVAGITEKRREAFASRYTKSIATGVVLCIVACVPLLLVAVFTESEFHIMLAVAFLLLCVAIGVFLIVWAAIIQDSYNQLLQTEEYTPEGKEITRKLGWFPGVYWLTVVAVFLAINLSTGNWEHTWGIWPIAGILYAVINGILRAFIASKSKK